MRITIRQDAPPGTWFTASAFDRNVGRRVPFVSGSGASTAEVVAAQVAADGSHVLFTLELPEDVPELAAGLPTGIGFRPVWEMPEGGDAVRLSLMRTRPGPPEWLRGFPSSFPPGAGPFDDPGEFEYPSELDYPPDESGGRDE